MLLTEREQATLHDICRRLDNARHDPGYFQSLLGRGLITKSNGGAWICTKAGHELIHQLYGLPGSGDST